MVLAAGLGTRFAGGGGRGMKVLAPVDGRPLLGHVVACAAAAGLSPVIVVVGPELDADASIDATLAAPAGTDVRRVVNDRPEAGMGASLAVGLEALLADDGPAACVVLLGDQPGVDPDVVDAVTAAWRRSGLPARAHYRDGASHPVLLPRDLWAGLIAGAGATDRGARPLLDTIEVVPVPVDGPAPLDVDEPADLARLDRPDGEADAGGPSA